MKKNQNDLTLNGLVASLLNYYQWDAYALALVEEMKDSYRRFKEEFMGQSASLIIQLLGARVLMVSIGLSLKSALPRFVQAEPWRMPLAVLDSLFFHHSFSQPSDEPEQFIKRYAQAFPLDQGTEQRFLAKSDPTTALILPRADAKRLYGIGATDALWMYTGESDKQALNWWQTQFAKEGGVACTILQKWAPDAERDLVYGYIALSVGYHYKMPAGKQWVKVPLQSADIHTAMVLAERLALEIRDRFAPDFGAVIRLARLHETIRTHWPPAVPYDAPDPQYVLANHRHPGKPRRRAAIPKPENGLARSLVRVAYEKMQRGGRWWTIEDLIEKGQRLNIVSQDIYSAKASKIFSGVTTPSVEAIPWLANVLGIDEIDLLAAWYLENISGPKLPFLRTLHTRYDATKLGPAAAE